MATPRVGPAWLVVALLGGAVLAVVLVDRLLRLALSSDQWLILLGSVTAITGAAATIAAFKSASAARDAARETHKAIQAQLVTSLRDAYASGDMLTAIHAVRRWKKGEVVPPDSPMDHARRMISHHFQKIATLGRKRLLDDDLLRVVAKANEVALFCQVIEPMEQQVSGHYDRSDFDLLADLYGGRDRLPPTVGPTEKR